MQIVDKLWIGKWNGNPTLSHTVFSLILPHKLFQFKSKVEWGLHPTLFQQISSHLSLSLPPYLSLTNFLNPDPKWNGLTTSLSLSLLISISVRNLISVHPKWNWSSHLSLSLTSYLNQDTKWSGSFTLFLSLSLSLTNDLNLCPKWNQFHV